MTSPKSDSRSGLWEDLSALLDLDSPVFRPVSPHYSQGAELLILESHHCPQCLYTLGRLVFSFLSHQACARLPDSWQRGVSVPISLWVWGGVKLWINHYVADSTSFSFTTKTSISLFVENKTLFQCPVKGTVAFELQAVLRKFWRWMCFWMEWLGQPLPTVHWRVRSLHFHPLWPPCQLHV